MNYCGPDPDPYVFGPPGSVFIFTDPYPDPSINKQKLRKTFFSTVLWLLNDLLSLKTDVNVPTVCNKQK